MAEINKARKSQRTCRQKAADGAEDWPSARAEIESKPVLATLSSRRIEREPYASCAGS
jgi:hypothetical protein